MEADRCSAGLAVALRAESEAEFVAAVGDDERQTPHLGADFLSSVECAQQRPASGTLPPRRITGHRSGGHVDEGRQITIHRGDDCRRADALRRPRCVPGSAATRGSLRHSRPRRSSSSTPAMPSCGCGSSITKGSNGSRCRARDVRRRTGDPRRSRCDSIPAGETERARSRCGIAAVAIRPGLPAVGRLVPGRRCPAGWLEGVEGVSEDFGGVLGPVKSRYAAAV
jgi:hypothetical protein